MKPLYKYDRLNERLEIIGLKQKFGVLYGIIAGLAFAVSSWGWDGYLLNKSHAYFPWTMLITGATFCAILGGIVGWLTARADNSLFGTIFWIVSSLFFAWLMVALPLQINPFIASKLDPQLGALLNYDQGLQFTSRFGVFLMWIIPFTLIVGVTQLPVTEPAVFSTSIFGKTSPFFFCIVVMSISGVFSDNLINSHFRAAIASLDNTIQVVLDNQNNENVDPALSRKMHAGALRAVEKYVQESRYLFVGSYDEYLGDLHVLVKFDGQWVDCNVLYSQPIFCKIAAGK
ncbi:MAG: hypothetical protein ACYC6R_09155 [Anaerolineales bacterium]